MEAKKAKLGEFHLLLIATGSVASVKIPILIKKLQAAYQHISIQLVLTKNSEFFIKDHIEELSKHVKINRDEDEWDNWKKIGDPILHIELTRWADCALIAPLDANTMAKLCGGICDNLLLSLCRAWNFDKPLLFAPAMNTFMWDHPLTAQHCGVLKSWGYRIIHPIAKTLACGDVGVGAMEEVDKIIQCLHPIIVHDVNEI